MTQPYDASALESAPDTAPAADEIERDEAVHGEAVHDDALPEGAADDEAQAEDVVHDEAPPEGSPDGDIEHESLGDPRVDEAVARLDELAQSPVSDHVAVFDDIHGRLRGALEDAAVDQPR